jgi:polyhydroxyalkanoate synthase
MNRARDDAAAGLDAQALAEWAEIAALGQRVATQWAHAQAEAGGFSIIDLPTVSRAMAGLWLNLALDPARLAEMQAGLWQDHLALLERWAERHREGAAQAAEPPARGDRRFADPAWAEEPAFDWLRQSYLATTRRVRALVASAKGLDPQEKRIAEFYVRQWLSAFSPANFPLTNPAVLRRARETGGRSLIEGLKHLLEDLEAGRGRLRIAMTDERAFAVGRNLATTPGKVIFQNDLMQLIQYAPTTETVFRRPLLIVPPWINKFYVLDLQPRNSFVRWAVGEGHTVFLISWANPGPELAEKGFADYLRDGPLAALGAIEAATGEREANVLGFCIGGILVATLLAVLAARGDRRLASATLLATLIDFTEVGEAAVFIDERQVQAIERHVAAKGYLEAHHLADMFAMMRENDLVWSFVVGNYLLGREPPPFDLLYWNADSTRLPARMLVEYLRWFYLENGLIRPGHIVLDNVPVDLGRVTQPVYVLATREDHIAPWVSCYPAKRHFSGAPVRFVLGGSGHIAGVINPPAAGKYGYWTNARAPADPMAWLEGARLTEGSWWPDWGRWLARRGGGRVPGREPGGGRLRPLEDAPGSYVRVRASE